ncbi:peroxidase 66-like [Argentina anserina]|uniref:peroxidase 66-like n=1 Tax=Argentina anserina TaxID=57926 RepID=UPI002176901F|nr:peroxidase 66-like [Potentilla anserina]
MGWRQYSTPILTFTLFTILIILPSEAQPKPKPQQPGPQPQQPKPQQPGPLPQQPKPQQPGPLPQQPAAVLQQPGPQQPGPQQDDGLTLGFYAKTCPKVENIVADTVKRAQQKDPKLPAAFIRLLFHDCWIKGCDASILLDSSLNGKGATEKMNDANGLTIRGLEVIDEIKTQLEKECPKTVTCADIIAFAAREAVILAGLPRYDVVAGRYDSPYSRAPDADNLPVPKDKLDDIIHEFAVRKLSLEDLVVLSGAHSIGRSQCTRFSERLYTFKPGVPRDPDMDPAFADELAKKCPAQVPKGKEIEFMVDFDPTSPLKLDVQYYLNLQKKKGLLATDQVLATDPRTSGIVNKMAADPQGWGKKFIDAMARLGRVNTLKKDEGQIRVNCRAPIG